MADKQTIKNYHSVPILPICSEMYESLITQIEKTIKNCPKANRNRVKRGDST